MVRTVIRECWLAYTILWDDIEYKWLTYDSPKEEENAEVNYYENEKPSRNKLSTKYSVCM